MGREVHVSAVVEGIPVEVCTGGRGILSADGRGSDCGIDWGNAFGGSFEGRVIEQVDGGGCILGKGDFGHGLLLLLFVVPSCIVYGIPPSILLGLTASGLALFNVATFLLRNIKYSNKTTHHGGQEHNWRKGKSCKLLTITPSLPPEDIDILVKALPERDWIDPAFPLHPILHPVLPSSLRVREVKGPQALQP
jgi:hypothetical protein